MQAEIRENTTTQGAWCVIHPLSPEDSAAMTALRSAVAGMKGKLEGTAARGPFDGIMEHVAAPDGVTFEADTVGGISGWWARLAQTRRGAAILHLHGGWFNWGTAQAFRNHLALVLLSIATAQAASDRIDPVAAVVLSPVTDLGLSGESFETRAQADPYFIKSQAAGLVRSYLGETDPKNPLVSPLYGNLTGLPAIRVHVGDDEVLLDDSRRYVERAVAAGVDATLDVWLGMAHGFVNGVGTLKAATEALSAIGKFLNERLAGAP